MAIKTSRRIVPGHKHHNGGRHPDRKCKKNGHKNKNRIAIEAAHTSKVATKPSLMQQGQNLGYQMVTTFIKAIQHLQYANQHLQFNTNNKITTFF